MRHLTEASPIHPSYASHVTGGMDHLPQQGSVTPCNASTSILIDAQDISLECREAEARHILPALCQRVHRLGSANEALPSVPVALDCKPCAEGQRQQITPAHQSDLFVLGFRRIALNMPSITAPCLNVLVTQTPCPRHVHEESSIITSSIHDVQVKKQS